MCVCVRERERGHNEKGYERIDLDTHLKKTTSITDRGDDGYFGSGIEGGTVKNCRYLT